MERDYGVYDKYIVLYLLEENAQAECGHRGFDFVGNCVVRTQPLIFLR